MIANIHCSWIPTNTFFTVWLHVDWVLFMVIRFIVKYCIAFHSLWFAFALHNTSIAHACTLPCCFFWNAIYYMSIFNTHIINSRPIFLECVILPSFFSNNCLKFNSKYFIIFKVEIVIKTVHSCKLLISWYAYFTLALTWMQCLQCLQNKASSMQMALISV